MNKCGRCNGTGYTTDLVEDVILGVLTFGMVHLGGRYSKQTCWRCKGSGYLSVERIIELLKEDK